MAYVRIYYRIETFSLVASAILTVRHFLLSFSIYFWWPCYQTGNMGGEHDYMEQSSALY